MTYEMIMELLATAEADITVYEHSDGAHIDVTVEDFEGFTDEWEEIDRELDNEELVDFIQEQLEKSALLVSGNFYRYYQFDGFIVCWGYASFDI